MMAMAVSLKPLLPAACTLLLLLLLLLLQF
jgi:hypothetical protein